MRWNLSGLGWNRKGFGAVAVAVLAGGCIEEREPPNATEVKVDTSDTLDAGEDGTAEEVTDIAEPAETTDASDPAEDISDSLDAAPLEDEGDGVLEDSFDAGEDGVDEVVEPKPPGLFLTVAQVPSSMNGSRPTITPDGPLEYHLRVNREFVELDLVSSGTVDWASLELSCRGADDAELPLPEVEVLSETHRQVKFSAVEPLPEGEVSCEANLSGPLGEASASYDFEAVTMPARLDPFPTTDVWVVQTERDIFETTVTAMADGTFELRSALVEGGDGVDDFDAPFYALGLMSRNGPEVAAKVRAHLLRKVKEHVRAVYRLDDAGRPTADSPNIAIHFEGELEAPPLSDFGKPGVRMSKIALTGDADQEDQLGSTFGRALLDWNNQDSEDDTRYGLGVWPAALARAILRNPLGVLLVADYRPEQGGIPFGEAAGDELFVGLDVDLGTLPDSVRARADIYDLIVNLGGLALASILCHEVGHSLGLVPYGAPPEGLFAGVEADFVVTVAPDAHIDTEGMNVMQTGGNLNVLEAFSGELPAFEPLSWAYLRRQLVVGEMP